LTEHTYDIKRDSRGREYDRRLEDYYEELYSFAERHGLNLTHRYRDTPTWSFSFEAGDINRRIDLMIVERSYVELLIMGTAHRDDAEARPRYFMKKPFRMYTLFLPTDRSVLQDTLELARRDALTFDLVDLVDTVEILS
jgi:hypothetical protein